MRVASTQAVFISCPHSGSDRCPHRPAGNEHTGLAERRAHPPQFPHTTNTRVPSAPWQVSCSPALSPPCLRTGRLTQTPSHSVSYCVKSQGGQRPTFSTISPTWRRHRVRSEALASRLSERKRCWQVFLGEMEEGSLIRTRAIC